MALHRVEFGGGSGSGRLHKEPVEAGVDENKGEVVPHRGA